MDIKHKEIVQWLREVYVDEKIPPYEKTERNINILYQLMTESKRTEDQGKVLTADCTRKAAEYNAEALQLKKWRETVKLETAILSNESQKLLSALSRIAQVLDVLTPTSTKIIMATNSLEMEYMQVTNDQEQEKSRTASVLEMKTDLSKKLEEIREIFKQAEAMHKLTEEEIAKDITCKEFSMAKSKNYADDISIYEAKLSQLGLTKEITHGNISKEWSRLQELEKEVKGLQKQLSYYTLPPDLALAEVTVQEARQEFAKIVEGLADNCDLNTL